ncbi:MAG TPA: hypothetical protein EYM37_00770 [Methylophaga aminisulfidivorans]|uniref:hypothetical protein n=1 Tax=Methylophaga TaxID=40222 RepID=UPI001A1170AC|nr:MULTISPECIES: hypothetical protein [Methylophaga]HIM38450.1 hypothetical protein [Methylophaga aminisulfidivorans]
MINEEIRRAKQAKQQRLLIGVIIVLSLILVTGLVLFSLNNVRFNSTTTEKSPPNTQPAVQKVEEPKNEEDIAAFRQAYLDAFSQYENTLKPQLEKIDIDSWDKSLAETLTTQEQTAVDTFGTGQYAKAKQAIDTLTQTAEKTLADSEAAFEKAMQEAQKAYDNYDYQRARLEIDNALIHKADSADAQTLAQKIENIPQIVELNEAIRVAKNENNPNKELSLIEELLKIEPDREEMKQRAQVLRTQLAESRFNQAISQAYQAIKQQQVEKARQALSQAEKIYPSRPENKEVKAALAQLESQLRFNQHIVAAEKAQQADNWETAKQELSAALKERPANKDLIDRLNQAKRIVEIDQNIQGLLQNPYRLSNPAVKATADINVIQAESFGAQSPSLAKAAQQLKSTINAVNTPVNVNVISDGKTFVSVRGVGKVGETTGKTIQLKPGTYSFEGKREGYRSKLIEVQIPLNRSDYQVTVIADERI